MARFLQTAGSVLCSDVALLLVAVILAVGAVVLPLRGVTIPDAYWALLGGVIGFYTRGRVGTSDGGST